MPTVELHPKFKQVALIIAEEFDYGDVIEHSWLDKQFRFIEPRKYKDFAKYMLDRMSAVQHLISECLNEHKIMLVNVRGEGYRLVQPKEQSSRAMHILKKKMAKEMNTALNRLNHVNERFLGVDDLRRRDEAIAKIGALACFAKSRRLTTLDTE
jgi:hypothetical protein